MNLQKLVNNMTEIVIEYIFSQMSNTPRKEFSLEELKKMVEDLNQTNPKRVPLLQHILIVVGNIRRMIDQKQYLSAEISTYILKQLTTLVRDSQVLMRTSKNNLVQISNDQVMYGLEDWSLYSGALPCYSGTLITDKLFKPLKVTKDSSLECIQAAVEVLIKKYQKDVHSDSLLAEIERLKLENSEAQAKIRRLMADNASLQEALGHANGNNGLITIQLTPMARSSGNSQPDQKAADFQAPFEKTTVSPMALGSSTLAFLSLEEISDTEDEAYQNPLRCPSSQSKRVESPEHKSVSNLLNQSLFATGEDYEFPEGNHQDQATPLNKFESPT